MASDPNAASAAPRRYCKRPVVIEAVHWTGDNHDEIKTFMGVATFVGGSVEIATLEGTMRADIGDWIVKGVQGEFYPVKPAIFEETYEPAE